MKQTKSNKEVERFVQMHSSNINTLNPKQMAEQLSRHILNNTAPKQQPQMLKRPQRQFTLKLTDAPNQPERLSLVHALVPKHEPIQTIQVQRIHQIAENVCQEDSDNSVNSDGSIEKVTNNIGTLQNIPDINSNPITLGSQQLLVQPKEEIIQHILSGYLSDEFQSNPSRFQLPELQEEEEDKNDNQNEISNMIKQMPQDVITYTIEQGNNSNLIQSLITQRYQWSLTKDRRDKNTIFKWFHTKSGICYELLDQRPCFVNHFEFQSELSDKGNLYNNIRAYNQHHPKFKIQDVMPIQFVIDFNSDQIQSQFTDLLQYLKKIWVVPSYSEIVKKFNIQVKSAKNGPFPLQQYNKIDYCEVWVLKFSNLNECKGVHIVANYKEFEKLLLNYQQPYKQTITESVVNEEGQLNYRMYETHLKSKRFVLQQYILNPLLIDDTKFNLIGMLLINQNIDGYICKDFMVQLANNVYNPQQFENNNAHLLLDRRELSSADQFAEQFSSQGVQLNQVYDKMRQTISIAFHQVKDLINRKNRQWCMEIFEFEFIVDKSGKPWLIEVNANPKWGTSNQYMENQVKTMLDDALKLSLYLQFPIEQEEISTDNCWKEIQID